MLRYFLFAAVIIGAGNLHSKGLEIKVGALYGLPSSGENQIGLSGNDSVGFLKIGRNLGNKDFGLGVEFTARQLAIVKASSLNGSIKAGELQYTVLAFPFYFTAYLPLQSKRVRPGLELAAYYLLINKPKMEQDFAFSLAPLIKFILGEHLDLALQARYLQSMGSTGSAGTSLLDRGRWSFGPSLDYTF